MSEQAIIGKPRFVRMEKPPAEFANCNEGTIWWLDTARPLPGDAQQFMAVQTYEGKDPNNFRRIEGEMRILFTDPCEYYFVCPSCYSAYSDMQWSGSTRGVGNWRAVAESRRAKHQKEKGWCQTCDPIFGNGGWAKSERSW